MRTGYLIVSRLLFRGLPPLPWPLITLGLDPEASEEAATEKPDRNPMTLLCMNPMTLPCPVYFSFLFVFLFLETGPQWGDLKLSLPEPPTKCWNSSSHCHTRLPSLLPLAYRTERCWCSKGLITLGAQCSVKLNLVFTKLFGTKVLDYKTVKVKPQDRTFKYTTQLLGGFKLIIF